MESENYFTTSLIKSWSYEFSSLIDLKGIKKFIIASAKMKPFWPWRPGRLQSGREHFTWFWLYSHIFSPFTKQKSPPLLDSSLHQATNFPQLRKTLFKTAYFLSIAKPMEKLFCLYIDSCSGFFETCFHLQILKLELKNTDDISWVFLSRGTFLFIIVGYSSICYRAIRKSVHGKLTNSYVLLSNKPIKLIFEHIVQS